MVKDILKVAAGVAVFFAVRALMPAQVKAYIS